MDRNKNILGLLEFRGGVASDGLPKVSIYLNGERVGYESGYGYNYISNCFCKVLNRFIGIQYESVYTLELWEVFEELRVMGYEIKKVSSQGRASSNTWRDCYIVS